MYSFRVLRFANVMQLCDALQFDVVEELASITIKANPLAEPTRDKVGKAFRKDGLI